jgi:TAT (twin-arginine translocation) pathway signal sequence
VKTPIFSRRQFLVLSAAAGAGAVLTACGAGSSGGSSLDVDGTLQVVKRFPQDALVAGKVRLPVSLADTSGILSKDSDVDFPDLLTAQVINPETGDVIIENVVAERHEENLSVPYWPFSFTLESEGIYLLKVSEAPDSDVSFQLLTRDAVSMPLVGDPLPPFDTPTTDNPRGVDPICTRAGEFCPFHSLTLTDALQKGLPVVYLIGTPAYCTTGTCAPGLDALIEVASSLGDKAVFVHADVYADKSANKTAPAVQAYKLSYEPVLYIADESGTLVDRLDAVFDVKEIRDVLAANGIS